LVLNIEGIEHLIKLVQLFLFSLVVLSLRWLGDVHLMLEMLELLGCLALLLETESAVSWTL
jgi:hypothetical protein